jgi:hypothetical protein
MKQSLLAVEPRWTDFAVIAALPPLPVISYDKLNADYYSDDLSELGGAECKAPISLKQTQFSLKQFSKRMGKHNSSSFNQWKPVQVFGCIE